MTLTMLFASEYISQSANMNNNVMCFMTDMLFINIRVENVKLQHKHTISGNKRYCIHLTLKMSLDYCRQDDVLKQKLYQIPRNVRI